MDVSNMAEPATAAGGGSGVALEARDVLRVVSRRFGVLEVPSDSVIDLPRGLVGLPGSRRFVLVDHRPGSRFKWLVSVDEPELGFVVVDPAELVPGYEPPVERLAAALGCEPASVVVFVLVTIPKDPHDLSLNLLAPVAVDLRTRRGQQVILDGSSFAPDHRVLGPGSAPAARAREARA